MKIFNGMKRLMSKYPLEKTLVLSAFIFALIGDMIYGGLDGAKETLVGSILAHGSSFFFTTFTIVILIRIIFSAFTADKFFSLFSQMESRAQSKPGPKKK